MYFKKLKVCSNILNLNVLAKSYKIGFLHQVKKFFWDLIILLLCRFKSYQ